MVGVAVGVAAVPEHLQHREDLRTLDLREHNPSDLITRSVPVDYSPWADCPRWEQFLSEVFGGRQEIIDYIRRAAGYSLTGSVSERCFFICYGTGSNGKSVFLDMLRRIAGDHGRSCEFSTVGSVRERDTIRNDLARLAGARLVTASEASEGFRLSESTVKMLTGGQDRIPVRFLHEEHFEMTPRFKLWLATNHRPAIRETSDAIWQRVHLIPFEESFTGDKCDRTLADKLIQELPGILAWAVRGCQEWQQTGLKPPAAVLDATKAYREENDIVGRYISERCVRDEAATVRAGELYLDFKEWCDRNGERPMSAQSFGRRMTGMGVERERCGRAKIRQYVGITISPGTDG